jgi:hypothetical protein
MRVSRQEGWQTRFQPGTYHPGWGEGFRVIFATEVPVERIKVVHATQGPTNLKDSPHYLAAQAIANGETESPPLSEWREYHKNNHGLSSGVLVSKQEKFEELVEKAKSGSLDTVILVRWKPAAGQFYVLDGFHRLAVNVAVAGKKVVRVKVAA